MGGGTCNGSWTEGEKSHGNMETSAMIGSMSLAASKYQRNIVEDSLEGDAVDDVRYGEDGCSFVLENSSANERLGGWAA